MKIRVLLSDDHRILREGLRSLLLAEPDMDVVGEADNGRAAVQAASELNPDVVVMDIRMPDLNGIDATRQLLSACPTARVICLSSHADERLTAQMLTAGATGYVVKDAAFEELATAIRSVMNGKVYLSDAVTNVVVGEFVRQRGDTPVSSGSTLSAREREVLQLIAEGKSNKEVAASLQVSVKTAETHRRNLMLKLGIDSVAELTKFAVREGITSLDR